jgi:DNA repair exonuclease SbcCD ATPase subunit
VGFQPSWNLWQIHKDLGVGDFQNVSHERVEIPVAHQLLQCDIIPDHDTFPGSPMKQYGAWIQRVGSELNQPLNTFSKGAKVKIKASFNERWKADWDEDFIRKQWAAATSVSIITDIQKTDIRLAEEFKADASMGTLLDKYVALNPDLTGIKEELLELSDHLEDKIDPGVRLRLSGADYTPKLLEWTNWKQYATGKLDFTALGPLTAITGGNALGKSNAAEVEAFILFKYLRGSSTLKDVIKHGQKECRGRLTFESRGKTWRVTRIVKRTAKGATADVVLEEKTGLLAGDATGWLPANKEDSRATQAAIEALVGIKEMYLATRYASQFDVDRILNMKPAELKDLIQEALPMALFEHRHELAKQHLARLEHALAGLKVKQETSQAVADGRTPAEQELAEAKTKLASQEDWLLTAKKKLVTEQTAARGLAEELVAVQKDVAALAEKDALATDLGSQIRELNRTIESLEKEVLGEPALIESLKTAEETQAKKEACDVTFSGWNSLELQAKDVMNEIAQATQEQNHILSKMEAERDRMGEATKLMDNVPCQALEAATLNESCIALVASCKEQCAGCQFLKKAAAAKDLLPTIIQGIKDKKAEDIAADEQNQLTQIRTDQTALKYDPEEHRKLKAQLQREDPLTIQKKLNVITEAKSALGVKAELVSKLEGQLTDVQKDLEGFGDLAAKMASVKADKNAKQLDVINAESQTERLQADVNDLTGAVGNWEGKLELIAEAEKAASELEDKIKQGQGELAVAQAYARAVHRDGLPFLLLEQAVPALAAHTNHFLGDAPLKLSIETGGPGKREEVSVLFQDDRGTHGLSEASGYQRMHLGASIRAGLIQIQADTMGTKVHHFFLDEGFGAYDQDNLQHGRRMLQLLAERFERVIFITHVEGMKQIADITLVVVPGADGSRLESR